VSRKPFSFTGSINAQTGMVTDKGLEIAGASVAGKVLVFPTGRGSSLGSYRILEKARCKMQPAGIISVRADPVIAVGAIVAGVPMVDRLDGNPLEAIRTGDWVEMDADAGTVRVRRWERQSHSVQTGHAIERMGTGFETGGRAAQAQLLARERRVEIGTAAPRLHGRSPSRHERPHGRPPRRAELVRRPDAPVAGSALRQTGRLQAGLAEDASLEGQLREGRVQGNLCLV